MRGKKLSAITRRCVQGENCQRLLKWCMAMPGNRRPEHPFLHRKHAATSAWNKDMGMGKGYFVTGTDTGVGKTRVSCALLHAFAATGKTVVGMKPVAAGCENGMWPDVELLAAASNISVQ